MHLLAAPAQPNAKFPDASRPIAGLANLAPYLLHPRAKLADRAYGQQAVVRLNQERDEGVPFLLQPSMRPPLTPIPSLPPSGLPHLRDA
jgi:hypothetical protein